MNTRSLIVILMALVVGSIGQSARTLADDTGFFLRWPMLFGVTGIEPDDHLNVRSGPSTKFDIVGYLEESSGPIEIFRLNPSRSWGRIHYGETVGWVSMRYLSPFPYPTIGKTLLPQGLQCSGTEPFWRYSLVDNNHVTLVGPAWDSEISARTVAAQISINSVEFPVAILSRNDSSSVTALVRPGQCSDGMSNREYGWHVDLIYQRYDAVRLLSGCCRLP